MKVKFVQTALALAIVPALALSAFGQAGAPATNIPPVVHIFNPTNGSSFSAPANIIIAAEAGDRDGTVQTVEFFAGDKSLGVVTNNPAAASPINPWRIFWTNVDVGIYALTAKATDNGGASTVSLPVTITVKAGTERTVVNIFATDPDATEIPPVPIGMGMAQRLDPAVFTVTRTGGTGFSMTVFYEIGGTASNGIDYAELPGSVEIPAGSSSAIIEIYPIDDSIIEGTETVILAIQPPICPAIFPPPPGCYLVGPSNRAIAYIHDDTSATNPPPPVVTIVATDPDASETGPDTGTFTVTRTGDTNNNLLVYYFTEGTAQNGIDYNRLSNYVVIPAGSASADIVVTPIDDSLVEGPETVVVQLRGLFYPILDPLAGTPDSPLPGPIPIPIIPPYVIGYPSNATVTIADNDVSSSNVPPVIKIISPASGSAFLAPANIPIVASAHDIDDMVSTVEFFENGQSLGVRTNLPVANPIGPFVLVWSNVPPGKYSLTALATDSRGATTLSEPVRIAVLETNRPPPPPPTTNPPVVTIVATDPIASEGTNFWWWPLCVGPGIWEALPPLPLRTNFPFINTATFKVHRGDGTNSDLTVYYSIGGTASNGVDYETLPGSVTIPAGERSALITVVPIDDNLIEPPETVILTLQLPPGTPDGTNAPYRIGRPRQAAAIIIDNDAPRPPCRILPDGLFHFCAPGTNGFWYRLECTTNMINWTPICTNKVSDGAIHFVDPDAKDSANRFYQALPEPNPPSD